MYVQVSKFRQFNDDNDTTLDMNSRYTQLQELQKFQRSEEMQRLMHGVSNTMGLNHTLSLGKYMVTEYIITRARIYMRNNKLSLQSTTVYDL